MIYETCIRANGTDCRAVYDDAKSFRYRLSIVWDATKPKINFLMLNPSTATERENDPTVEGCERRAREWGFGGLIVTNLFAIRATDPREMLKYLAPDGPANDHFILEAAREAAAVVAAWGNHGGNQNRSTRVRDMLREHGIKMDCLFINKSGEPKHPLYVARSIKPTPWEF